MSDNETLESILKEVSEPRVQVVLDEKRKTFLRAYASDRHAYNERQFTEKEMQIVRNILDNLYSSYIMKYEHAEYKLSLYSKKVLKERDEVNKLRKYLQKIGEGIYNEKRTENQAD